MAIDLIGPDSMQVNSPVSVAVVLAGAAIMFREIVWGVKTLRGNGLNKMEALFEKMTESLNKLNEKIDKNNSLIERTHDYLEWRDKV